jgi:hypothetical protein
MISDMDVVHCRSVGLAGRLGLFGVVGAGVEKSECILWFWALLHRLHMHVYQRGDRDTKYTDFRRAALLGIF